MSDNEFAELVESMNSPAAKRIAELERELAAERALSNEMAAQLEHASFAYDPGGCQKMFEAWKDAREP
jgi:transposase-like protein